MNPAKCCGIIFSITIPGHFICFHLNALYAITFNNNAGKIVSNVDSIMATYFLSLEFDFRADTMHRKRGKATYWTLSEMQGEILIKI